MNKNETHKMKADESVFATVLLVVLLVIIPSLPLGKYGGGVAMVAVSVIGLIAYMAVFGGRLRERGQLKSAGFITVLSFVLGAILATVLAWLR